ncbi:hypothetical protein ACRAWG_24405 [Methylobacterium sp. P31]
MVLDTSHFGQWVKDANSRRADDRRRAAAFRECLEREGWICAFSHEHLAEIYAHADPDVRASRLTYLRSIPLLAYVTTLYGLEGGFGSIVEVLAKEVEAALSSGAIETAAIAAAARSNMFAYTSGSEIMSHLDALIPALENFSRTQAAKARKIVALSRADVEKPPDVTVAELLRLHVRTHDEREAFFQKYGSKLLKEVVERGDTRIQDPEQAAEGFAKTVREAVRHIAVSGEHPVRWLLDRMGLREGDIQPDTRLGDLLRISHHRRRALIVTRGRIDPREVVERVETDRLPSAVISDAIERFGQEPRRRKGSVLNDIYLLSLSPYVHLTSVDKGTYENVMRASARSADFKSVIGVVARRPTYSDLALDLKAG